MQMSKMVQDIQSKWEQGVSVYLIAKEYNCKVEDIMVILGIWSNNEL